MAHTIKTQTVGKPKKVFQKYNEPLAQVPDLIEMQTATYGRFLSETLPAIVREFSPIEDYSKKKFALSFLNFELMAPEYDEYYAKENKKTFEASMKARVRLENKITGGISEQDIGLGEIPMMTPHGTFVINGVERVVVPQLARSFGIFVHDVETRKGRFFGAKVIPARGVWITCEIESDQVLYAKIDEKRKFPITMLLRVLGMKTNEEILSAHDSPLYRALIERTLAADPVETPEVAFTELYKRQRDGEHATVDNAREFANTMFSSDRYDLTRVGRFHINKRYQFGLTESDLTETCLSVRDIVYMIADVATRQADPEAEPDDIDHLGMRRIRFVGELLEARVRKGFIQVRRNIQDRMSTVDTGPILPVQLINQRPLQARIREFFATSQLSQFMEQENQLAELEHLRTLSALGPGGLTRERAGFEVRDIHPSHYGRVCPIQTPEGQNIGLILRLSVYARVNDFGMIETPYMRVVKSKVTKEMVYLNAFEEEQYVIAHFGARRNDKGEIVDEIVEVRVAGTPRMASRDEVQLIDVASHQTFSVATSLIPFVQSDAPNRALMGSNMQKQATPVLLPDVPCVSTGMEAEAATHAGRLVLARESGIVSYVDAQKIIVDHEKGKTTYQLITFGRTNNESVFHHTPSVSVGQSVNLGDVLADGPSTRTGQLALGQDVRVAFMCWRGNNFEDAIILSERLVRDNKFASIRIEEYECIVRDTKLGPEVITPDIPNVSESKLRFLDEEGVIRVGSEIFAGDIMVGKITPKGEVELTPEERLLRSIFGDKARDVKDTSLRMDYGKRGRIIGVKIFSRDKGDDLESGVLKKIYIEVAVIRHVQVGDKLAGRHGNKGVISVVLPAEDMPYTADGQPVDVILTPLGVPSRMNLGQVLEVHLGLAAHTLGYQAIVPPFCGATETEIKEELIKAGYDASGKVELYDGLTGQKFEQPISIGYMHILKLHHMVDDKIHARAIGPYSLITQQPLGGKSQSGGQRFGEMEVWALEGYGAAYTLREMLTIKSDDIVGRTEAFESIIRGQRIRTPHMPASFKVLLNYLRGLSFDVKLNRESFSSGRDLTQVVISPDELDIDPPLEDILPPVEDASLEQPIVE